MLRCGGAMVWRSCGVGELWCGWVAVWGESYGVEGACYWMGKLWLNQGCKTNDQQSLSIPTYCSTQPILSWIIFKKELIFFITCLYFYARLRSYKKRVCVQLKFNEEVKIAQFLDCHVLLDFNSNLNCDTINKNVYFQNWDHWCIFQYNQTYM